MLLLFVCVIAQLFQLSVVFFHRHGRFKRFSQIIYELFTINNMCCKNHKFMIYVKKCKFLCKFFLILPLRVLFRYRIAEISA